MPSLMKNYKSTGTARGNAEYTRRPSYANNTNQDESQAEDRQRKSIENETKMTQNKMIFMQKMMEITLSLKLRTIIVRPAAPYDKA